MARDKHEVEDRGNDCIKPTGIVLELSIREARIVNNALNCLEIEIDNIKTKVSHGLELCGQ